MVRFFFLFFSFFFGFVSREGQGFGCLEDEGESGAMVLILGVLYVRTLEFPVVPKDSVKVIT